MEKELLLSILIPTYNGASKFLDKTMESLIGGVQLCEEGLVEVVLSSNASTDNTLEFLKQYDKYPFVKYHSNETNIGFARNIIKLTDEHAKGKFGWVIGDDDVIVPAALPHIVEELKKDKVDYLSVDFTFVRGNTYTPKESDYTVVYSTFAEALERVKAGNVLGTFMSSAIVRLSLFRQIPKEVITPAFDTYQSIFPNGYVNATAYHDKRCAYMKDYVILSFVHEKEWGSSDNMYLISEHIIPSMYEYILSLGVNAKELKKSYKRILHNAVYFGYLRLLQGKKTDKAFGSLWQISLKYPSVHFALIKTIAEKMVHYIGRKK